MLIKGLDKLDNKIINLLLQDGRMSYSEIGQIVGLSRTSVKNRIAVLEEDGVISGYKVVINALASPQMMTFIVNIETKPECFEKAKESLSIQEETVTIVQTTGNCHLLAVCMANGVQKIKEFMNRVYKEIEGITSINAQTVLEVIKGNIIPEK